jgi:hypothetical protein
MQNQQNIPGTAAENRRADDAPLSPGGNSASMQPKIRDRALELARARGQKEGYSDEDWRLAEEEILHITGGG